MNRGVVIKFRPWIRLTRSGKVTLLSKRFYSFTVILFAIVLPSAHADKLMKIIAPQ